MIEKLTAEKLKQYGFGKVQIDRLLTWQGHKASFTDGKTYIFASADEKKIYTGQDALRKLYLNENHISFPIEDLGLIPEYYQLKLSAFMAEQKQLAGSIFNEKACIERFRRNEADLAKNVIESLKTTPQRFPVIAERISKWTHYLDWLNSGNATAKPATRNKLIAPKDLTFAKIFSGKDWKKYITALQKTDPPLLNEQWEFIGRPKKDKGVICAWIKDLQYQGIIKKTYSRAQLAQVLNKELKNFNLGSDGKTLDNISTAYNSDFKLQLKSLVK